MAKSAGEAMKTGKRDRRKEVKRAATDGSMQYRRHHGASPDTLETRDAGHDHSHQALPPQDKKQRRIDEWQNDVLQRLRADNALERPSRDEEDGLFNSDDIIIPSIITAPPKKKSIMHFWKRIG
jgi:hypothetical protein